MTDPSPAHSPTANAANTTGAGGPLDLKKRARRRLVGAIALVLLAVIVLPMVMDQEPKPITQDIQIRIPSQEPGSGSFISRIKPTPAAPAPTPLPAEPPAIPAQATTPVTPTTAENETKPAASSTPGPAKPTTKTEEKTEVAKPNTQATILAQTAAVEKPVEAKTEPRPDTKAAAKTAEKGEKTEKTAASLTQESARATALLNDERWIVQLGAYQDQANIKLLQGKIKELGYPVFTEKVDTANGSRIRVRCGPFPSREAAEKAQARLKKIAAGGPTGGVVAQMQ